MKVRKGQRVRYVPSLWDRLDPKTSLQEGAVVKVCHPHGCPGPNVMGCCHVETIDGQFLGLVSTASLEKA